MHDVCDVFAKDLDLKLMLKSHLVWELVQDLKLIVPI